MTGDWQRPNLDSPSSLLVSRTRMPACSDLSSQKDVCAFVLENCQDEVIAFSFFFFGFFLSVPVFASTNAHSHSVHFVLLYFSSSLFNVSFPAFDLVVLLFQIPSF